MTLTAASTAELRCGSLLAMSIAVEPPERLHVKARLVPRPVESGTADRPDDPWPATPQVSTLLLATHAEVADDGLKVAAAGWRALGVAAFPATVRFAVAVVVELPAGGYPSPTLQLVVRSGGREICRAPADLVSAPDPFAPTRYLRVVEVEAAADRPATWECVALLDGMVAARLAFAIVAT